LAITRPRIETAFGEARNFLDNRFIYLVISQRARGLSIGINMNPDQNCNFKCIYCEVARDQALSGSQLNVKHMSAELRKTLILSQEHKLQELPEYRAVPEELLQLRMVALSGDGEPTLCPFFEEVVQDLVHLRAQAQHPFFKVVLITNATGLHLPNVQNGLRWFTAPDEVWVKLDAGTPERMHRVNRSNVPLERVLSNILELGRLRPVVIQSLFALIDDQEPSADDIQEYVKRLAELKAGGAQISLVQIYSAHRPTRDPSCRHLSLKCLSQIVQQVRATTGLEAEVF
jgi:wyosine [tRNA(Phe)-imidazoG37] synthetase (radical SAM superfamily)